MGKPFDSLSRSHPNFFASDLLVTTLVKCGLKDVVLCPGSRNSPLSWAFSKATYLRSYSCLDERSAGFLALGLAKKSGLPVVVVVTSGTAVANLFPSVVEASESGVPCLMISADRPPEWQGCNSPQTIRQTQIFGTFAIADYSFPLPEDFAAVWGAYAHQTREAWMLALQRMGPVHLNVPFRKPLVPLVSVSEDPTILSNPICFLGDDWIYQDPTKFKEPKNDKLLEVTTSKIMDSDNFLNDSQVDVKEEKGDLGQTCKAFIDSSSRIVISEQTGIIICGCEVLSQDRDLIDFLSVQSGFPVLSDVLSNLRRVENERIISFYDLILRRNNRSSPTNPEVIFLIGSLPTSQVLRNWLSQQKGKIFWLHFKSFSVNSLHLRAKKIMLKDRNFRSVFCFSKRGNYNLAYFLKWKNADKYFSELIQKIPFKPSQWGEVALVCWLSKNIQPVDNLFIGNSNPVRDFESFFDVRKSNLSIFFNRGANGIDGTLSTAIGIAESNSKQNSLAVLGDLSFLYDSNGLLLQQQMQGNLRIFLIDNQGGAIFSMLPAKDSLEAGIFEKYWATPQKVNMTSLVRAYQCKYYRVENFDKLSSYWRCNWEKGISVFHLVFDSEKSTSLRKNLFQKITKLDF